MRKLRPWQDRFLRALVKHGEKAFLLVAVQSSGKTFATCMALHHKLHIENIAEKVLIVVPTLGVRTHWAETAQGCDLSLDSNFENTARLKHQYDGMIITYQSLASNPLVYCNFLSQERWVIVFDEVHHLSSHEDSSWGEAAQRIADLAQFIISLSGTPFRTDSRKIPFLRYEASSVQPDFELSYDEAVREPERCVRKVYFKHYEGQIEWEEKATGERRDVSFEEELNDVETNIRLSAALRALKQPCLVGTMIQDAHSELQKLRKDNPTAGAMVLCIDQLHAERVAGMMAQWIGIIPAVAISKDKDAQDKIEAFKSSNAPWLVSVQMVSEGVDIPKLQALVYATTTTTELFFRQAVGRVLRIAHGGDALIYHPDDPRIIHMAKYFTKSVDAVVIEEINNVLDYERQRGETTSTWKAISALGQLSGIIHRAEDIDAETLSKIEHFARENGMNDPPEKLAFLLQSFGLVVPTQQTQVQLKKPLVVQRDSDLRTEIRRIVSQIHYKWYVDFDDAYRRLNKSVGIYSVKDEDAGIEKLEALLRNARDWYENGRL